MFEAQSNLSPYAQRPTYTEEQLDKFFGRLGSKPRITLASFKQEIQHDPLKALKKLQILAAAFIPWTSVSLHYSTHHTLSLDPNMLYHKIVERQLGGYCMENNTFMFTVLHSLGYDCYITGARISDALEGPPSEGFRGWSHQTTIVTLGPHKYAVDIGLGAQCAIEPLLLEEGAEASGVPGVTQRLVRRRIAPFTTRDQTMWVIQMHLAQEQDSEPCSEEQQQTDDTRWSNVCCFDENEWLPQDFEIINYHTSRDPRSMFTYRVLATKPILSDEADDVIGVYILVNDEITKRSGKYGKKEVLRKCESEEDRVDALARWLDMKLTTEEVAGIKGRATEIK
ncbi:hypothetical protein DV736_g3602, partial [Chaetothyriales sp. CBS 134916]